MGSFVKAYPGNVYLTNITIFNFQSADQPIFYVSAFTSFLEINGCQFYNLNAGSFINSENNLQGAISINNTEFKDSFYSSSLISLSYSQMKVENVNVQRSYAEFKTNGFILINADLEVINLNVNNRPLSNTKVNYLTIVDFGFFNLVQGSSLIMRESSFQ